MLPHVKNRRKDRWLGAFLGLQTKRPAEALRVQYWKFAAVRFPRVPRRERPLLGVGGQGPPGVPQPRPESAALLAPPQGAKSLQTVREETLEIVHDFTTKVYNDTSRYILNLQ